MPAPGARTEIELSAADGAARRSYEEAARALAEVEGGPEQLREHFQQEFTRVRLLQNEFQPREVVQTWKQLYEQTSAQLPTDDPLVLTAGRNYAARLQLEIGREAEALQLAERIAAGVPDLDHSEQGREVLGLLVGAARRSHQYQAAVGYAERQLVATRLLFGEGHVQLVVAHDLLARALGDIGDFDAAEQNFAAALDLLKEPADRAGQIQRMFVLNNRADFLRKRRKEPRRAEPDARTAVAIALSLFPADHNLVVLMKGTLAEILVDQERFVEAMPLLEVADRNGERHERATGRSMLARAEFRVVMAKAYLGVGDFARAADLLQKAWSRLKERPAEEAAKVEAQILARRMNLKLEASASYPIP